MRYFKQNPPPLYYLYSGKGLEAQFRAGLRVSPLGTGGSNCWWKSRCCRCCCCCQTSPPPGLTRHSTLQIQLQATTETTLSSQARSRICQTLQSDSKLGDYYRCTYQNITNIHTIFSRRSANDRLCLFFWRLSCVFCNNKLYSKTTQICSVVPVWDLIDCTHGIKPRSVADPGYVTVRRHP